MTETWLPIPGYADCYEVSDRGRIKSLPRFRVPTERILKPFPNGTGHLLVDLNRDGQRRTFQVHLLVLRTFVGTTPEGLMCRHLNGDPGDNRLVNLRYGTRSENMHDAVEHGTHPSARVTHCPMNHPYDGENTYVNPRLPGSRICLTCKRKAQRDYQFRKKAGILSARKPGRPRKGVAT